MTTAALQRIGAGTEADRALIRRIAAASSSPHRHCQFIAHDPRIDASACGAATEPGLPYCMAHALRCYDLNRLRQVIGRPAYAGPVKRLPGNGGWLA